MSFDRKLDFVCPHQVVEEALNLSSDRQTIKTLRPISAINSIKLRIDGEEEVPSFGLNMPAQVMSSRTGPFTIQAGVNDTLIVDIAGEPRRTITVPAGKGLSAHAVAQSIAQRLTSLSVTLTAKQRIQFQSRTVGGAATFMFKTGSTLAPTIGVGVERQWKGRTPYPGWSTVLDPRSQAGRPIRLIVFDQPLKGYKDFVEIDYTTIRQECRRCGGLGIEQDWRYSKSGDVITVQDEALLIQEMQKTIYTIRGSNRFHLWYGTDILNAIGKKLGAGGMLQNFIVSDIRDAFRRWQVIKTKQEGSGQLVSDEEFPFQLLQVILNQSQKDPTIVYVTAYIQNRSLKPIEINRGIKIPQPFDLLTSSTQDGLIRQSLSNFVLTG